MTPEFRWHWDRERASFVITRGQWVYQVITPNRHNPAHTRTYVERSVRILNGETP